MTFNCSGKTESWKLDVYNQALQEMFHTNRTLDGVFIDSYAQECIFVLFYKPFE